MPAMACKVPPELLPSHMLSRMYGGGLGGSPSPSPLPEGVCDLQAATKQGGEGSPKFRLRFSFHHLTTAAAVSMGLAQKRSEPAEGQARFPDCPRLLLGCAACTSRHSQAHGSAWRQCHKQALPLLLMCASMNRGVQGGSAN